MKLVIIDYDLDFQLSMVENINFIPTVNEMHSITTEHGQFDVNMVDVNLVTNTITVHSAEYTLNRGG